VPSIRNRRGLENPKARGQNFVQTKNPSFTSTLVAGIQSQIPRCGKYQLELDRMLRQPARRAAEFSRYERQVGRVMDLYLKFVTSWYTQEFAEVFFHPQQFFQPFWLTHLTRCRSKICFALPNLPLIGSSSESSS
jgi:hypothetical protein